MPEIILEHFNQEKHDIAKVADLIFRTDPELNPLVFGEKGRKVIEQLLTGSMKYRGRPFTESLMEKN